MFWEGHESPLLTPSVMFVNFRLYSSFSSSEIIQFDWLALTSFLPCSWPSFTSWLCSISPSLPLGRATLPSLVRTHGSPGRSIYPSVFTPLRLTSSIHCCHFSQDQGCLHFCEWDRLTGFVVLVVVAWCSGLAEMCSEQMSCHAFDPYLHLFAHEEKSEMITRFKGWEATKLFCYEQPWEFATEIFISQSTMKTENNSNKHKTNSAASPEIIGKNDRNISSFLVSFQISALLSFSLSSPYVLTPSSTFTTVLLQF